MQNAAIQALGLDWMYVPFDVAPENLESAVQSLRTLGFVGTNCTVPLKEQVGQYLDMIDPNAEKAGSVNTIVNKDGKLHGYSTDGPGLIWDLERQGIEINPSKKIFIWGAGGSARAIAHAFANLGCKVTICNRTITRAEELARSIGKNASAVGTEGELFEQAFSESELLINTTTLGMHGDGKPEAPLGTFQPSQVVYDIVYTPSETPLLASAKTFGCHTINGLGMLACQGALSLALWTGLEKEQIPLEVMINSLC
jgi:shikimate dehydrogenase